ncbi:MAG: DsrE family protein [Sneathiellaceae bacterium]
MILFILNDPPYGTERVFNALRLAHALRKRDADAEIVLFLMADAVIGARQGQTTPDGFYNVERMLKRVIVGKGRVLLCGTCMDARGMTEGDLMQGAVRSTMDELAEATARADRVLVF